MFQKSRAWWTQNPVGRELALAPLVMAGLYLFAYWQFFSGDRNIATFQDNTHLMNPLFHHISNSFRQGDFPYWIDTLMAGLPLYNSPQFSPTYPLYFFQSGLYGDPLAAMAGVHYVTALHLFILYVNAYVLLRVLGLTPLPSLLGASLLGFSANTFDYSTWVNIIAPYSWFPLAVAAVFMILEDRHARRGVLLGALSLGLLTLASTAQPLIHALFVMAALYLAHAARRLRRKEFRPLLRATGSLLVMGLLAVLLAAPSVFTVLADTKGMIRFLGDHPPVMGFDKLPFRSFLEGQLRPAELAGTLIPLGVPRVIGNSFVGAGAVLLALFAFFKAREHWAVWPLLFIALYGLLSATGTHLGMAYANYQLPLINKIREPPRHLFLFVMAVSILAAYGFSYLLSAAPRGGRPGGLSLRALLPVGAFAALSALALAADFPYVGNVPKAVWLALVGLSLCLLLALPWARGRVRHAAAAAAVLLIIFSNLQYPRRVPKLEDGDYFSAANLTSHNTLSELARLEDARQYRIIFQDDQLNSAFWSMNASYHGLRTFQAYMNPLPRAQFEEVYQRFNLRNYYPLLGAKYYLCNPCDEQLARDFQFAREINGYKLHVAARPFPRYALVNRVGGSYAGADDFYNKVNAGFDYLNVAYVRGGDLEKISGWVGDPSDPPEHVTREEHASLNALRLSVNTRGRSLLILNEYYNKAWKARVNGVAARTFRVNLNQIGVLLERGANQVEFQYRPLLFIRALWLQRATFAGLVLYALYLVVSSRRAFGGGRAPLNLQTETNSGE